MNPPSKGRWWKRNDQPAGERESSPVSDPNTPSDVSAQRPGPSSPPGAIAPSGAAPLGASSTGSTPGRAPASPGAPVSPALAAVRRAMDPSVPGSRTARDADESWEQIMRPDDAAPPQVFRVPLATSGAHRLGPNNPPQRPPSATGSAPATEAVGTPLFDALQRGNEPTLPPRLGRPFCPDVSSR